MISDHSQDEEIQNSKIHLHVKIQINDQFKTAGFFEKPFKRIRKQAKCVKTSLDPTHSIISQRNNLVTIYIYNQIIKYKNVKRFKMNNLHMIFIICQTQNLVCHQTVKLDSFITFSFILIFKTSFQTKLFLLKNIQAWLKTSHCDIITYFLIHISVLRLYIFQCQNAYRHNTITQVLNK